MSPYFSSGEEKEEKPSLPWTIILSKGEGGESSRRARLKLQVPDAPKLSSPGLSGGGGKEKRGGRV